MPSLANMQIIGHLGKSPVVKKLPSGSNMLTFSVAVTENKKSKEGVWSRQACWYNVIQFTKFNPDFVKGSLVYVAGRFELDSYTDKEGKLRVSPKIVADKVLRLEKREDKTPSNQAKKQQSLLNERDTEEVPF